MGITINYLFAIEEMDHIWFLYFLLMALKLLDICVQHALQAPVAWRRGRAMLGKEHRGRAPGWGAPGWLHYRWVTAHGESHRSKSCFIAYKMSLIIVAFLALWGYRKMKEIANVYLKGKWLSLLIYFLFIHLSNISEQSTWWAMWLKGYELCTIHSPHRSGRVDAHR